MPPLTEQEMEGFLNKAPFVRQFSNGVKVSYDDLGEGDPVLLFMNGWCAPRTYYRDLVAVCSPRRRCLAMDWPGHGDSEELGEDFGEKELVEAAKEVIKKSGAERVVPVAQAHAGWVAIELRRQLGEMIEEMLLLDWLVLEPPKEFMDSLKGLQSPENWSRVRDSLFSMWLSETDDQRIVRYVRDEMGRFGYDMWSRAGREIEASYRRHGCPLRALEKLSSPPRVLHVFSTPKDEAFLRAQQEFARSHPWFRAERLEGRTHFPALEDPKSISALLDDLLLLLS